MVRQLGLACLAISLFACASPTNVGTGGTRPGTSSGPGVDLGGFIAQESGDLATGPTFDFAIAPAGDLGAGDLGAGDLAQIPPADMTPSSSACGAITYAGKCTANTLTYCSTSSQLTTVNCAANSRQCTVVSGDANCRFVAGAACGSVTSDGVCDGDTLAYCNASGKLSVQNCASSGMSCIRLLGVADCF